jgi:hypothetical protein
MLAERKTLCLKHYDRPSHVAQRQKSKGKALHLAAALAGTTGQGNCPVISGKHPGFDRLQGFAAAI